MVEFLFPTGRSSAPHSTARSIELLRKSPFSLRNQSNSNGILSLSQVATESRLIRNFLVTLLSCPFKCPIFCTLRVSAEKRERHFISLFFSPLHLNIIAFLMYLYLQIVTPSSTRVFTFHNLVFHLQKSSVSALLFFFMKVERKKKKASDRLGSVLFGCL